MVVDTLLVLDNIYNRATVIASVEVPAGAGAAMLKARFEEAESRIDLWLSRLESPSRLQPLTMDPVSVPASVSPYPDDTFRADVGRIKEYIAAGDIFQAVLSRRIDLAAPPPFLAYRYLRALNPAPYLYYLSSTICASSADFAQVLVRVEDGEVVVRPIAGTRARGAAGA
jgi:anthranilate synthase component 1